MTPTLSEFLQQFVTEDRLSRFHEILSFRTRHLTVVLENVFHAHNASACLRTCDCFGIQDVHIIESRNEFEPNQEIALGASQWLTLHQHKTENTAPPTAGPDGNSVTLDCLRTLKQQGYQILATSPRQNSTPINDTSIEQKTAVVFGAEQLGVSDTAIEEADSLVHIPMYGFTESFNISVSVAIILHQMTSVLAASGINWRLTTEERDYLLHEWVCKTLGPKLEPLKRRYEVDYNAK